MMKAHELYRTVGRMTGEGMGETSKVCRAVLFVLANEYHPHDVLVLLRKYIEKPAARAKRLALNHALKEGKA